MQKGRNFDDKLAEFVSSCGRYFCVPQNRRWPSPIGDWPWETHCLNSLAHSACCQSSRSKNDVWKIHLILFNLLFDVSRKNCFLERIITKNLQLCIASREWGNRLSGPAKLLGDMILGGISRLVWSVKTKFATISAVFVTGISSSVSDLKNMGRFFCNLVHRNTASRS